MALLLAAAANVRRDHLVAFVKFQSDKLRGF
jgi:hypothetical protein